jgi:N utilization substance protein B
MQNEIFITRHIGREVALLWLFQIDVGQSEIDEVISVIPEDLEGVGEASLEAKEYAQMLVRGIAENRKIVDANINKYAVDWDISRMSGVDRNILRIAMYEVEYVEFIPASVAIDEAVEIAKKYGAEDSPKFINGILGAYMRGEGKN